MSTRDEIRSKTVGGNLKAQVKLFEYEEVSVEFRQPTVGIRKEIFNRSQVDDKLDIYNFLVWSVIYCTFVPGTKERVYEDADFDSMMSQYTGSFVDIFSEEISEIMNVSVDKAVKNSDATPTT